MTYTLISREQSGLLPAKRLSSTVSTPRVGVVVHCPSDADEPADLEGALALARKIQEGHFGRGFGDTGYHYFVWRDVVILGRAPTREGAHAMAGVWPFSGKPRVSFNRTHYGACILADGREGTTSPLTMATVVELADALCGPECEVVPHRSLTKKRCPGKWAAAQLPRHRNPYVDQRTGLRNR
jgi:hypothetical protein